MLIYKRAWMSGKLPTAKEYDFKFFYKFEEK